MIGTVDHRVRHPDGALLGAVLVLACFGMTMSVSARVYQLSGVSSVASSVVHLLIGIGALSSVMIVDYRSFTRPRVIWLAIMACSALLLVALFSPSVGNTHRWIRIAGFSLQPSELAKPVLVIAVAAALVRAGDAIETWAGLVRPLAVAGWLAGLVVLGKDLGTPTVMFATAIAMCFVAGARLKPFLILLAGSGAVFLLLSALESYRWKRLMSFTAGLDLDGGRWDEIHYQLQQSLLAVGSGGLWGKGFGMSTQKANFLPEIEDDFIFAFIGEELGLIGALAILCAFLLIGYRGVRIATRSHDDFGRLIALGATWMLCLQALVHAGVVTGVLPTKGMPLPFLSAGGSSLLASCLLAGLVLNVSLRGRYEN
jgi:cell division protein FtsW